MRRVSMNTKLLAAVTTGSLLMSAAAPFSASANSAFDASLYPTPEGVTLENASYNEAAPDWNKYDALISQIRSEMDMDKRAALMHQAEDILMETAAVLPIVYTSDAYLQRDDLTGIFTNPFGTKYFFFASGPEDHLAINIGGEPQSLDPAIASAGVDISVISNLFCGLYTYNEEGQLIPCLADDDHPFDVSEDGLEYTFYLKEGLKWSDGSPLTAEDFVYSWKRAALPETGAPYSYLLTDIFAADGDSIDVSVVDERTLTFRLQEACPYLLGLTTMAIFFPVKQDAVETADIYGNNPVAWVQDAGFVTSGAYTVEKWRHDDALILKKNPNWHLADRVNYDNIDVMLNSDGVTVYAAYSAGNLSFADNIPSNELPALKERDDFHIVDMLGVSYLIFNVNSHVFFGKTAEQAANIRKAISLLIDRDYLTEDVYQRGQKIATSFIPYGMTDGSNHLFKENSDRYTYPLPEEDGYFPSDQSDEATAEAISLLESAGYQFENGKLSEATPLRINMVVAAVSRNEQTAEAIQQDLLEVGIDLDIDTREFGVLLAEERSGAIDLTFISWNADYNDPMTMLEIFSSGSGNNLPQLGKLL